MSALLGDLRYCLRRLARAPAFALTAIVLLALALAANAAAFAIIYDVLYKPLPYPDASRLAVLSVHYIRENQDILLDPAHIGLFENLPTVFDRYGGFAPNDDWLIGTDRAAAAANGDEPVSVHMAFMEPAVFAMLGMRPLAGRLPTDEDARARNPALALASASFAKSHYGDSRAALGQILHFRSGDRQIIGVLPDNSLFADTGLWYPVRYTPEALAASAGMRYGYAVGLGHLAPGVTAQAASARLDALAHTAEATRDMQGISNMRVDVKPVRSLWSHWTSTTILALLAVVTVIILIITAANVCNLYIARLAGRQQESALIEALGGSPRRLRRLYLLETGVLCLAALLIGLALVPPTLALIADAYGDRFAAPYPPMLDAATGLAALLEAALVMLALYMSALWVARRRGTVHDALKSAGARQTASRRVNAIRASLTVGQVALTTVLLAASGLLMLSADRLVNEDMGFDRDHVVMSGMNVETSDDQELVRLVRQFRDRATTIPGVTATTRSACNPIGQGGLPGQYQPPGSNDLDVKHWPGIIYCSDNLSNFFSVMGISLLSGRPFSDDEVRTRAPVAIVDEAFARRIAPTGSAIGRHVRANIPETSLEVLNGEPRMLVTDLTIVGVAHTVKTFSDFLAISTDPVIYTPGEDGTQLFLRTSIPEGQLRRSLHIVASDMAPHALVGDTTLLRRRIGDFAHYRFPLNTLLVLLAGVTIVLTSIGLYAVIAYGVRSRVREFGVWLALGADGRDLRWRVMRQGAGLVAIGLLLGAALLVALSGLLRSQLYHVSPFDPLVLSATLAVIGLVSMLATWRPAAVAARVDPMTVLRAD